MNMISDDYRRIIDLLNSSKGLGIRPGLSSIEELLSLMNNPEKQLKFIHVAGTNGKGSTSAFIASILIEAGYKVGTYNSPYIQKINEIIKIDNEEISDSRLLEIIEYINDLVEDSDIEAKNYPTEFEIITSAALQYFLESSCDYVILEVGMGGRLDATNIIPQSEVSVITPIGMDHMNYLGDTLEDIAREKAGIIKPKGMIVSSSQEDRALEVIKRTAEERGAAFKSVDNNEIFIIENSIFGQIFTYKDYSSIKISLLGRHQRENAALAIEAIEVLIGKGHKITRDNIYGGLLRTLWPGRLEVMRKERPLFIRDGAHNIQGAQALYEALTNYFPGKKITFILGFLRDKSFLDILEIIRPIAGKVFLVTPNSPRAISAEELRVIAEGDFKEVAIVGGINDTVEYVSKEAQEDEVICAFGSLYFIGEIKDS